LFDRWSETDQKRRLLLDRSWAGVADEQGDIANQRDGEHRPGLSVARKHAPATDRAKGETHGKGHGHSGWEGQQCTKLGGRHALGDKAFGGGEPEVVSWINW